MKTKFITGVAAAALLTSAVPTLNNLPFINQASTHQAKAATDFEQTFLDKASRQAQKAAKKYGVYPSVMIAQAIIESDWGRSGLATSANNLFGIKAGDGWAGQTYTARTREESRGKSYYINAAFRKYSTYEGSFDDNGNKLRNGVSWDHNRYKNTWIENALSYHAVTKALTGTYATASNYNKILDNKIATYDLTQYDPKISDTAKTYTVAKSAATYDWPADHSVAKKESNVNKGEKVTVDKTITYYNGSKRMHITGRGWVNSSVFEKDSALPAAVTQAPKGETKTEKNLMHNAYVYDEKGKRIKGIKTLKEDSVISTYGTKTINKKKYYRIGENQYIAAGNIDGTLRVLKHNTYVYNQYANRDNDLKYKKGQYLATYGSATKILGKKYYRIGVHEYVKKANF